jgi:hypothetical protein
LNFDNPILEQHRGNSPEKRFAYQPDFWRNSINPALQTAEDLYDHLYSQAGFPAELAIE